MEHCFSLVFQWLVSQVLETRQARGEAIRRYATFQFDQHFNVDKTTDVDADEAKSLNLGDAYAPKRKFRQKVKSL